MKIAKCLGWKKKPSKKKEIVGDFIVMQHERDCAMLHPKMCKLLLDRKCKSDIIVFHQSWLVFRVQRSFGATVAERNAAAFLLLSLYFPRLLLLQTPAGLFHNFREFKGAQGQRKHTCIKHDSGLPKTVDMFFVFFYAVLQFVERKVTLLFWVNYPCFFFNFMKNNGNDACVAFACALMGEDSDMLHQWQELVWDAC